MPCYHVGHRLKYKKGVIYILPKQELLDAMDILAQDAIKNTSRIYNGIVTQVANNGSCSVKINGNLYTNVTYYGLAPKPNLTYRIFVPDGNMNLAFLINPQSLPKYSIEDAGKALMIDSNGELYWGNQSK